MRPQTWCNGVDLRRAGDVNPLICCDCWKNPGTYVPGSPLEFIKSTPLQTQWDTSKHMSNQAQRSTHCESSRFRKKLHDELSLSQLSGFRPSDLPLRDKQKLALT